jgi:hypothetical protein
MLLTSTSQGQSLDTLRFPFIRYEKNVLAFPGGTQNFEPFYQKVQKHFLEGTGAVNIMHIGGSHVQAGIWTEAIWKTIETRFPDASVTRGLLFPYSAIGTTQPGDYIVDFGGSWHGCRNVQRNSDCSLGVMGISASTQDSGAFLMITHRPGRGKKMQFRRLKIFHHNDAETFAMSFRNDSLAVLSRDSTDSYTLVEFSRVMDTLYLQLDKTDSLQRSFSLYGFRIESDESGLCFDVIGNNGADLPSYLKCDLFEQQLRAAVPDVVILSVGINDAYTRQFNAEQYKNNYRKLVSRIRASAPDCAILFTTNNDSYYRKRYPNLNGAKVQKAIFELAEEYNAGVWDLYEVMGGQRSINQWVAAKLARTDRIHFTSGGYHVIGTLLSDALMNAFLEFHSQHLPGD